MPREDLPGDVVYHVRRAFLLFVAWLLVVVGILGLILPVIPGLLFLLVGLALLAAEAAWAARVMDRVVHRFPWTRSHVGAARHGAKRVRRTVVGRDKE